ncbi:Microcephalin [Trachymyrmex septentrionalis]|uniref:Microcephalin n=1 Tax=Trachymyrmex septentrionalis TaxID=34720 RepID=A0A195FS76_9HYME|nr:Microcephalin [Trachymyrmex septentrionalis]
MSFNKRKIFASDTSDEDDSFNHRRSSLRVNLSYSKNLTDSGNGSLWRTEIENDQRGVDTARTVKRLSRKKSMYEKNHQSDFDNKDMRALNDTDKCAVDKNSDNSIQIKKKIQLKCLTINLEDISTKECYLETNCNRLKDAILSKTKQMFDKENELSVKITKVLGNKENGFTSSIYNSNMGNKTVMLDMTDLKETAASEHQQYTHNVNDQKREDQYSNIVTTPLNHDRRRSLEKSSIDKSRLIQRQLFVEEDKQIEGQTKCRIIEDVVLKKNFPLFSLRQATQSSSPILSGSNKKLSLIRRSKLHSQNKIENLNNTFSTIHSVQNFDIETPIVCSTFIEDNATGDQEINSDVDASRATHTTTKVISMEMTEVHGGIHTSEKRISVQNRNSYINNYNENKEEKSKKESIERSKTGISSRLEDEFINKITESDVLQAHEHDSKAKCQNEKCNMMSLSNSNNSIRSSLNVNTSLDVVTETSKANVWKSSNHRTDNTNQNFEATNNKESVVLNNQRESTNTNRTSLQMNTSVDSMRKIWRRRSDKSNKDHSMDMEYSSTGDKEINDIDSLENISLTERLRNISMRNEKISHKAKSKVFKMKDDKRRSSNSRDSYSYVEGTPYPISRSVLFKSQLKYKTQHLDDTVICGSKLNTLENEEKGDETKSFALHSKVSNEMHMLTEIQKTTEANSIILEDTPNQNPFIIQNQLTVIKGTPDGTKSETGENILVQNTKCTPVKKRRLLPLTQISQYSLSPIEERKCTPEESIKQMQSDSDCDMLENKKKEKKTRKPKKVISKKIFIKKFADEKVLNILERSRQNKANNSVESRDSLNDFVKCRTTSTQWNKYKSQKIIIVTTGLSKEDKSLVKSIVKSLGAAELELNVSKRTTHVVSTGVRTVNLLRGIIRGCWLVTLEWVLKSLENNGWLNPETFEMKHFSKAVQENRKDRQLFGPSYIPELFGACGFMYVEHKTTVPCNTLKELIKTAGGHITDNTKLAKIIIGTNGLKETWIIDSITTGELQLTKLYQWNNAK